MENSTNSTDQAVPNARRQLGLARIQLREAESTAYCCEHAGKAELTTRKKEVKRWETWLADRDELMFGAEDSE